MSLAAADKLLKIFDALKNFREGIPVVDPNPLAKKKESLLSKKDRTSHLNSIPDLTCSSAIRSLSEFPRILAIAVDSLLSFCDDQESDVRLVAGESLNKLIKGLMDTCIGRIHVELYKEIKKNGSARSLRAALSRFGELCHFIKPQKCRPFIANLLPCIARTSLRSEEAVQETLASAMHKVMPVLGSFTNDTEIKQLLKTFLPNLKSSSATTRRTAASSLVVICQHSWKPNYFYGWLLNVLLGMVLPFLEDKDANIYLGALMCLRHVIPNLSAASSDQGSMRGMRGSFGSHRSNSLDTSNGDDGVKAKQLMQAYEVIMYCTKHNNHNVVTASLETLLQLLRTPPPTLLPVLLSCEGITPTITADSTHEGGDEAASDGDSALDELETASIAGSTTSTIDTGIGSSVVTDLEDDQVTADDMLRSPELDHLRLPHDQSEKSDDEDVFSDTMRQTSASIGLRNSRSLSDPGHSVVDGNFAHTETVRGVSEAGAYTDRKKSDSVSDELDPELTHCDDNGDDDDDAIRTESISTQEVKLLLERSFQIDAVACRGVPLVHCVRLMCSFLLSGNPGEMLADSSVRVSVKSLALSCIAQAVRLYPEAFLVRILPDGPEDDVEQLRHTSPQLVRDILLFSGHGDPQLRGSLASVIGSVIETGLKKGRLDFDTWCIDSCQEMETAPLALEDLVSVLKVLFQDESPVAIRQACISLKSCFTSLCCSKHSKLALDLIDVLVQLKNNSYWLVKVELLEILENIDFRLLTFLRTKFKSQKLATPRLFKSSVQEDLINGIVLHLLDDDDIRVRQAAARCMVRLVPQLFYSLEKSLQAAAISTSQSQLSNLNLYQNQRQLYEQAVIEGNLSRVVELVTNKLNHSTSRTSTLGCFRVLSLLIETFPAASHPAAWGCSVSVSCRSPLPTQTVGTFSGPPRPSSPSAACTGGGGPLATAVGCMTSSWLAYDLLAHQHLLQIAGNIMFGAGCSGVQVSLKMFSDREYPEEPVSSLENWSVFSDTSLAPQAEKLMLHLARLLNIFSHVIDNVNPGAHSFKISFPGQHKEKQSSVPVPGMATPQIPSSSPGSTPGSAVPKRLLTKTKRALSEADLLQGSSDKSPAPAKSTAGQAPETENSQNPSPKSSIGTFHHLPHYMKLFEILKGAFANNQVTLMDPTHDKFCQFVTATLETLALFLEVIAFADIGKHVEELLGYLQVCVKAESLKTFLCVQQLLRAMFGINALSQPDLAQAPVFPPCLADTQVTMPTFTDKQQSMQGRLYHTCFVQPMALLSQTLEKLRRTDECKGNEKEVEATGLIGSLFKKITKKVTTSVRPAVKLDKQSPIHSYIRLFETLVIRALKEYTMSSSVPLQQQVLSLLAQLVKLRVNYSLLDADQVFISYVQKQFEYIDAGQIRACDTFLPHVFQFLVLLSYQCYQPKFNQAKAIVGMPRIIQLCDGIMAGGQPARTHAIPALQPIVYDLFVLRAAGKSDVSNELETQREVVVSMLFRLIHYSEVLEMLVTILNCYQYDHGKWKKLSSEVMDLLVSDLVSQKVQVESEYGMEMLQSLLAAVAPVALDPIDVLLKPLFSSVSQAWSEISKRWLASTVVILHTIMAQVTEDTLLARINKSGLRPDCFHLADTSLLPQEMFVKFLFHVVEVAASHIHSVTRDPSVDPTFLTDDLCLKLFSNLLVSLVHILKSANFKKVYQVAASFRLIEPSVSRVNEILPDLVDTHPALVLQWCQVLRQLKYSDSQFWCAFMDKGSRLSTASGSSFELEGPTLNKEITRLGVILLYCDLLISQHMDQGELNLSYTDTLLKMSLVDLVEMAAEPPVHGLLSILYSSQVGSKLLLDAVTCSRDIDEAVKQPRFLKDLLSSLNGVHHSQSLQLVRMLVDRFLDSCHRSVVRIVERLICERLEVYRIGLKTDISQDLMEDDLRSICQSIAARNITNRSPSLSSLVNKVFPAKHPLDREMPSSDQLASSMSNYTIDQGWFFRLAEQCCFANNPSKQRIRAGSPTAAVKMLSALSFQEVSTIANHKDFDVSLLEECILRGVERTLLFTARRQNLEETGSSLYENAGHFESTGVDHLLVVAKLALFKHVERVTREVVQTRLFKDGDTGSKLACFYIAPERLSALCSDVTWCKEVTCLAKALVVLACAMPSLPRQCEVPQTDQESIFQFVFVPLSISHWNLVSGKVPSSDELKTHLDCLAKFLHLDWHKSVGELEFFPLVCSAISHVHALLDAVEGQAKNSQVELFSEETESDVAGNGVQFAMKACKEISLVVQRLLVLLKLDSESESTVPRFLIGPFQSVIVGLGRQPLVNNHARTLPLVWKMGWTPTPEGPLQTELPPLPIEILKEKDVLDEFVRRVNLLGWTSRQQFEETWAALLGVISSPPLPDTVSTEEDMESTHSCCLAVRCISELLLQTTLYPVPGSPCTSAYLHRPRNRDLPFLGSRAGKKLTFVRGIVEEEFVLISCLGAGRTFLCGEDVKAECCVSIHRANSFLCTNSPNTTWTTNRMLFDHPLYGLNIDRVLGFHDFTLGQVSIAALNNQAHAELQELSDSEDEGAIVVSVPRMPKPEKLDIKSCEQFLLELFEQWMSPYIQPRTPLALLSEATKALLVLSDLFVDGNHFEWVLETLLDLHHNHSTEDDLLTQYLLPTLCKALAFLKVEGPSAERVCKILETSIRSPHVPLQVSALYGAMYLLESHVPAVVAMLLPVLIDFLKKKLASLTSAVSLVEHHLLVMWSTAFYLLERYADEISDQEFKATVLKSAVRIASSSEDSTPTCVYHAIMRGLERLVVSFALTSAESDSLVKLSVDRLSMQDPQRAISALGLLITCMYTGKIGDRPSGIYPNPDTVEFPTEDRLLIAMERVTVLFDRIRKGFPSEAKVVARVLPSLLIDFFPAQEIMNKVIGEFLSSQQPHPELMAGVLFKVFEGLHSQGQQSEVRNWVLLSLGSFIQRKPLAMAVWSLTCFFVSASTSKWLRALFSHILGRMGKLEAIDVKYLCAAALDFFKNQNLDHTHKETFISTFQAVASTTAPYRELVECCLSHAKQPTICG